MKKITPHLPAALLVAEAIYLAFVPVTIAHSIILFSLAGLFAFNQYLSFKEAPNLITELSKLRSELELRMEKQKEHHEHRLKETEDELARISLNTARSSSSFAKDNAKRTIQF